jgi:hypothetical protein
MSGALVKAEDELREEILRRERVRFGAAVLPFVLSVLTLMIDSDLSSARSFSFTRAVR